MMLAQVMLKVIITAFMISSLVFSLSRPAFVAKDTREKTSLSTYDNKAKVQSLTSLKDYEVKVGELDIRLEGDGKREINRVKTEKYEELVNIDGKEDYKSYVKYKDGKEN